MRRPATWTIAVLLTAALASGCGGSPESGDPMPTDVASTIYLTAVCPANDVFEEVGALTETWEGQGEPLTESDVAVLEEGAGTLTIGAQWLREPPGPWPTDVQRGVAEVADEMSKVADSYEAMADAESHGAAYDLRYTGGNSAGGEANRVRERLGLPPDDAPDNGCS